MRKLAFCQVGFPGRKRCIMTKCYLCETSFQLTEKVFQKDLLYAQITIKRKTRWKDMVLTIITRNSNDEAVVLCKRCLVSVLSRCAQEVGKTNVPMIAGIQFRSF